jgi:hypothetical protein
MRFSSFRCSHKGDKKVTHLPSSSYNVGIGLALAFFTFGRPLAEASSAVAEQIDCHEG